MSVSIAHCTARCFKMAGVLHPLTFLAIFGTVRFILPLQS